MPRFKPWVEAYLLATLSLLFYLVFLSDSGFVERASWEAEERALDSVLERLTIENLALEEKERMLKNDSYALEKEAKKYYFLSENAQVLKFQEPKSTLPKEEFQTKAKEPKEETSALPFYRAAFFTFQVFLWLGMVWKWKGLPFPSK